MSELLPAEALSVREENRLAELEQVINANIKGFVLTGMALMEIRDSRLYRQSHKTFESYCSDIWEIAKSRAYQLIDASVTVKNLSTIVDKNEDGSLVPIDNKKLEEDLTKIFVKLPHQTDPSHQLPANEAQARELVGLSPEEQQHVWQTVIDESLLQSDKNGKPAKITALAVKKAVLAFKDVKVKVNINRSTQERSQKDQEFFSQGFNDAFNTFLEAINIELDTGWLHTSRLAAVKHLDTIRSLVAEAGPKTINEPGCSLELSDREKLKKAGFSIYRMNPKLLIIERFHRGDAWETVLECETAQELLDTMNEILKDEKHLKA